MSINKIIKEIIKHSKEDYSDYEEECLEDIDNEDISPRFNNMVSTLLNENIDQADKIFSHIFKKLEFKNKEHDWQKHFFCKCIQSIGYDYTKHNLSKKDLDCFEYHYSISTQEFGKAIAIDFDSFEEYIEENDYGFFEKELNTIIPLLLNSKERKATRIVDNLFTNNFNKMESPAEFICNLNIDDNLKFKYLKELDLTGNDYAEIIKNTEINNLNIADFYKTSLSITKDLVNNVNNALDNYSLEDIAEHCFLTTNALHLKADKEKDNLFRSRKHYGKTLNYLDQNFHCLEVFELEKITDYVNNLSTVDIKPFYDYLREHTDTLLAFSKPEHFKRGMPSSILFSLEKNKDIFFDNFLSEPVGMKKELLHANFEIIKYVEDNVHLFQSKIEEDPLIFYLYLRSMYQEDLENNLLFEEVVKNEYMLFSQLEELPLIELSDEEYYLIKKVSEKLELRIQLNQF
jgi:hypothetical protein